MMAAAEGLQQVVYVVPKAEAVDGWAVLSAVEVVFGVVGVAGTWLSLGRRAYVWTFLFLLLQAPIPFVIGANRCDVERVCEQTHWAMLPRSFFTWKVPFPSGLRHSDTPRALSATKPPPHHLSRRLEVYPDGARVPDAFLRQTKDSDLGGRSGCFADWDGAPCDAYVVDIDGDGAVDVLLVASEDRNEHQLAAEIFSQQPNGAWAKRGELLVTCPDSMKALRRGAFSFATPRARDVVLSGRQFNLLSDPAYDCSKPGGGVPNHD